MPERMLHSRHTGIGNVARQCQRSHIRIWWKSKSNGLTSATGRKGMIVVRLLATTSWRWRPNDTRLLSTNLLRRWITEEEDDGKLEWKMVTFDFSSFPLFSSSVEVLSKEDCILVSGEEAVSYQVSAFFIYLATCPEVDVSMVTLANIWRDYPPNSCLQLHFLLIVLGSELCSGSTECSSSPWWCGCSCWKPWFAFASIDNVFR